MTVPSNLTVLGGAAVASIVASTVIEDKTTRTLVQIAAAVAILTASFDIVEAANEIVQNEEKKFIEAVRDAADLPFGKGSVIEQTIGFFGRLFNIEPKPGIEMKYDRGADKGPYLGTPKNVDLIAGKIRTVEDQIVKPEAPIVEIPSFADTVLVDAAIENQSSEPKKGQVNARLQVQGVSMFTYGPTLDLKPGAFETIKLRVPRSYGYFGNFDLALQWGPHTLDRITFTLL